MNRRASASGSGAGGDMITTLQAHGDHYILEIDAHVIEKVKFNAGQPLEVTIKGNAIALTPVFDSAKADKIDSALNDMEEKFGQTLRDLAQ